MAQGHELNVDAHSSLAGSRGRRAMVTAQRRIINVASVAVPGNPPT
jgi:hypothetical protein